MQYDHNRIAQMRDDCDTTWDVIADEYNEDMGTKATGKQLRQAHNRWLKRQGEEAGASRSAGSRLPSDPPAAPDLWETLDEVTGAIAQPEGVVVQKWEKGPDGTTHIKYPGAEDVDLASAARKVWADMLQDIRDHALPAAPPPTEPLVGRTGTLAVLAIQDPHFGMLAYGREVGEDQDIRTIEDDYRTVSTQLLGVSRIYAPERIAVLVGNDMAHVNQTGEGGKGGATKRGTQQDLDTRLSKIFKVMERAAIATIDTARTIAPVDVIIVPGNHDPDEAFRLGRVIEAWYRNDDLVRVFNEPKKRKFYGYGKCAFMLTHGEEYNRKRDSLPLVFATECPADIWVESEGGSREVLTGHNHIRKQGAYHPTSEVDETRQIVTRSLPGLTATDAWHYEEGYRHKRAATLLIYDAEDGFTALHEAHPTLRTR